MTKPRGSRRGTTARRDRSGSVHRDCRRRRSRRARRRASQSRRPSGSSAAASHSCSRGGSRACVASPGRRSSMRDGPRRIVTNAASAGAAIVEPRQSPKIASPSGTSTRTTVASSPAAMACAAIRLTSRTPRASRRRCSVWARRRRCRRGRPDRDAAAGAPPHAGDQTLHVERPIDHDRGAHQQRRGDQRPDDDRVDPEASGGCRAEQPAVEAGHQRSRRAEQQKRRRPGRQRQREARDLAPFIVRRAARADEDRQDRQDHRGGVAAPEQVARVIGKERRRR